MQLLSLISLGLLLARVRALDCEQAYVQMDVGYPTIDQYDPCFTTNESDGSTVYRCGFRLWRVKKSCNTEGLVGQLNDAFRGDGPVLLQPEWLVWDIRPTGDVHCASQ
jgi:hypothetical protein